MSDAAEKRTPLYDEHVRLGAKIIPFGGWLMPVQYSSIMEEHQAVRNNVGVFDISHMGQLVATGPRAGAWLNTMLTNNIAKLEVGAGQYTFLLNDDAGIIDDLIVYRIEDEKFLLVVNASRIDDDFAWLQSHLPGSPTPGQRTCSSKIKAIGMPVWPFRARASTNFFGIFLGKRRNCRPAIGSRGSILAQRNSGSRGPATRAKTGSKFSSRPRMRRDVWNEILEKGSSLGIRPCGLGARDTLRLEMCYPLNGSDLSPEHNPLEAGLGFFVDLTKPSFTGRERLQREKTEGLTRRLVPFRMKGKGPPPRPHYRVFRDGAEAGELTSGTLSPSLNYGIGMAYLTTPVPKPGEEIEIEIRGQKFPAVIEKKPLYKKP